MTSREEVASARSLLFVPGNRPERFAKAVGAGADVVIVDLEDAVGPSDKVAARDHVADWLVAGNVAMVRINASGTPWHDADVELVQRFAVPAMLAKAESPEQVSRVAGDSRVPVVPLIETAAGVLNAAAVSAAPGVVRTAFGSIDLATELGVSPEDREALLFARSSLVFGAAAARVAPPIDGVTTALTDPDVLASDVRYATRVGLTGKLCIHPAQVPAVHELLAPSAEDLDWAQRVLAAVGPDGSATSLDGKMIDTPVIERARRLLASAQRV